MINVYAYLILVIFIGIVFSYWAGGYKPGIGIFTAIYVFFLLSIVVGFALVFPVPLVVTEFCNILGITGKECIKTDNKSELLLSVPLVLFPIYIVCMFVGRAVARNKEQKMDDTNV